MVLETKDKKEPKEKEAKIEGDGSEVGAAVLLKPPEQPVQMET